jgi:hypothetical protein
MAARQGPGRVSLEGYNVLALQTPKRVRIGL